MLQLGKGGKVKELTGGFGNLGEVDLDIGDIEEDVVDGFLFQSYNQASDLPTMLNVEVLPLDLQCVRNANIYYLSPGEA